MTISRTTAAAHLNSQFSALATETSQAATDDSAAGYGPDIDNALRLLGVAEADLAAYAVAESDRTKYFAALKYYAAERFCNLLSYAVNVSLGPQSKSGASSAAERVCKRAAEYKEACNALGIPPDGAAGSSAWQSGTWSADWQEPMDA